MAKKNNRVKNPRTAVPASTARVDALSKPVEPQQESQGILDVVDAVQATYKAYLRSLTPRTKLIDSFLVFLVALGALQFAYVLAVGSFPFNAFLGGFIACVGQFVLTVSLRMQYTADKTASVFPTAPERALADYVFASLILHFIVFHFIN